MGQRVGPGRHHRAELGSLGQRGPPDARFFKNTFLDSKPNPSETDDYTGVTGSFDGLEVDVLATSDRQYYVWICCRAWVAADPGFAKATMSSSSMSCHLPFLVVEEQPF